MSNVLVVGGGIAGLSAGFRLRQAGHEVTVLEAADAVGGKMVGSHGDGYAINRGAQLIPAGYKDALRLLGDVGESSRIDPFVPVLAIVRDGVEHRIRGAGPGMVIDGLKLGVISAKSKLLLRHALADAVRMRRALNYGAYEELARWDSESVADYCARRLNDEIRDYVIDPLMRGLVLVDSRDMPVVDFFFIAANLLGGKVYRYPAGIDFLPRAVADHLEVRLGARVERIEKVEGGVEVTVGGATERADGCVIALPGSMAADVYPALDPRQAEIISGEFGNSAAIGIHLGLSKRVREGDQVATMVPQVERPGICTITFEHNYMPSCAPAGKGLVSAWFDHEWSEPRMGRADEHLVAEMLPVIEELLPEARGAVDFTRIDRWSPCVPMNKPGVHTLVAELVRSIDPADRVQLAGDYFGSATINAAVVSGEAAAKRLAGALG